MDFVFETLLQRKITVATAESCTGGMLAARITALAGVSAIFGCGVVTYSNEAKMNLLHVPEWILKDYGAVSRETALAMAKGLQELSEAEIAVAITGIAGPGGGTAEKPVGLVYIGVVYPGGVRVEKYNFKGDRLQIRTQSCDAATQLIADVLGIRPN